MRRRQRWIRIVTGVWILTAIAALPARSLAQSAPATSAATAPDTAASLSGTQAWQALVGNTVVADSRAGSYTEFFDPDGSVKHLDKDGRASGKWVLQDSKVCFDFPEDDDRICTDVEVTGSKGAFIDQDGGRDAFEILTGNAKKL